MAKKKVFQISNALTEGLEETITAAQQYSGELRIDVIPIKRIEVDPQNPRDLALTFSDLYQGLQASDPLYNKKSEELASLQSIANSITDQGVINPIVVYKFADKYRLVAGERRTLASILAGKQDIQAKILDSKPDQLKISLLQWIENVERSDLTLWERLRNLEKIVSTYTAKKGVAAEYITVTELSRLIGCSKPHAMNYKAVLMADEEIKKLIQHNKIRNLEKAALISSLPSVESKQYVIDACLSGTTLKKLKVIADEVSRTTPLKVTRTVKRGRQPTGINFGATKNIKVAKVILDAISQHASLSHVTRDIKDINFDDYQSLSETFKKLVNTLEKIYE